MKQIIVRFRWVILLVLWVVPITGCAVWDAAKVPFDKFSRVMSGESRYEKKMERYQRAVEWEKEYEQMKENRTLPPESTAPPVDSKG